MFANHRMPVLIFTKRLLVHFKAQKTDIIVLVRNRPDIRLNPVPAGYPASISGSGSGPVSKNFAGFLPDFSSKKCISKILKCIVFVQF